MRRVLYVLTTSIAVFFASVMTRKVDVVVSVSHPFTFMLIGHIVSKLKGVPHLIEARDLGIAVARDVGVINNTMLYKTILSIENYIYRAAEKLIVVSDGFKERLVERCVDENKISVVELGYDGYEEDESEVVAEWVPPKDKFIVLYSGTLGYVFDLDLLIEAAIKLRHEEDILFVVLGGGQSLGKCKEEALLKGGNVKFLGGRPKHEVSFYCKAADVCVYPARDGLNVNSMLGNKVFDYMGNGAATIYSGEGGDVSRLLERSGGGVVCEGNSLSLSAAIIGLRDDRNKARKLGDNAKRYTHSNLLSKDKADEYSLIVCGML